ncbi:MAG: hypothetical protein ACI81G_001325 [Gammaproteobacteria bacterium]|jgi:hypothetical protein
MLQKVSFYLSRIRERTISYSVVKIRFAESAWNDLNAIADYIS